MCSSGRWRASRTPRSIASRYKAPRPESTARFLDSWLKLIGKMIRRTAWVNLRVKGVMGQNCPPTAGLASRDGYQGQARARERGLNRHQGPRSGDSNDRTRNCPPPQEMATLYHRERARQHRSMLFGFSWSRPPRSGLRWDTAPDSLVSSAVVGGGGLRPVRAEHFQFRASHVPALAHGSRGNLGVPIAADLLDASTAR